MPIKPKSYELVPVEIWKYIITFVIDGSFLLSASPFECDWTSSSLTMDWMCPMYEFDDTGVLYWGMHDKPVMYQFRKIRGTLRRVCRGWKQLVDSPYIEHRCMRLCIPSHSEDEKDANRVTVAKRLEVVSPPGPLQFPEGAIGQAIRGGRRFSAEILLDIGGTFFTQIFPTYNAAFPFLTTLVVDFQNYSPLPFPEESFCFLILLPKLDFLTTLVLRLTDEQELDGEMLSKLSNLTTLSIGRSHGLPLLDYEQWSFPLLTHLELECLLEPTHFTIFFKYLPQFSEHLRYLRIVPCEPSYVPVTSQDIWSIWECSQLERLEMPLQLLFLTDGEPHRLPRLKYIVHTAHNSLASIGHIRYSYNVMQFYGPFIRFCIELRSLKAVSDSHYWPSTRPKPTGFHCSVVPLNTILAQKLGSLGLRYEDKRCETMAEAAIRR